MLAGPNGAGKSTILSAVSQTITSEGEIRLDGLDVRRMKPKAIAQKIGVLGQEHFTQYAYTVEQIVAMGRYAHAGSMLQSRDERASQAIEQALAAVGMTAYRKRNMLTLSGGEKQRVYLAQVLAQEPQLLMLDEPANHLDLSYIRQLFDLVAAWCAQPGHAVISVVHDLSIARLYGTHALLIDQGKQVAYGTCAEVLTEQNLQRVWQMDVGEWMRSLLSVWRTAEK